MGVVGALMVIPLMRHRYRRWQAWLAEPGNGRRTARLIEARASWRREVWRATSVAAIILSGVLGLLGGGNADVVLLCLLWLPLQLMVNLTLDWRAYKRVIAALPHVAKEEEIKL